LEKNNDGETSPYSHESAQERGAERDEVSKNDAHTSGEENEGLSTVLSAEPLTGVQDDESEE
jgi:hypothetical protein